MLCASAKKTHHIDVFFCYIIEGFLHCNWYIGMQWAWIPCPCMECMCIVSTELFCTEAYSMHVEVVFSDNGHSLWYNHWISYPSWVFPCGTLIGDHIKHMGHLSTYISCIPSWLSLSRRVNMCWKCWEAVIIKFCAFILKVVSISKIVLDLSGFSSRTVLLIKESIDRSDTTILLLKLC